MANLFTQHPQSIGETYGQHCRFALWFAMKMLLAGLACFIHSLFPFLFQKTASNALEQMVTRCQQRRQKSPVTSTTIAEEIPHT